MDNHKHLHKHNVDLEKLLKHIPQEKNFSAASELFQQLSDPTRLKILWLLAHSEECVNNISVSINMSVSAVSHQLKQLRQNGLIVNRRAGKEIYYKLADTPTAKLLHEMIDDMFQMNCSR